MIEGDTELQGVKAKVLQRALFVGKQLIVVHGLARRTIPATVWHELHAYYRLAEMLDCAVTAVTDEQMPLGVGTSCYSIYSHAVLLALADPCARAVLAGSEQGARRSSARRRRSASIRASSPANPGS